MNASNGNDALPFGVELMKQGMRDSRVITPPPRAEVIERQVRTGDLPDLKFIPATGKVLSADDFDLVSGICSGLSKLAAEHLTAVVAGEATPDGWRNLARNLERIALLCEEVAVSTGEGDSADNGDDLEHDRPEQRETAGQNRS